MKRHVLDDRTLTCICGRTKEDHFNMELASEKVRERWANGDVDIERDFAEIDTALKDPLTK